MMHATRLRRAVVFPLVITFLLGGLVGQTAVAGMIGTDAVLAERAELDERARIQALLDREDVQEKLVEYGVSPETAAERVAAMTREEVQKMAQDIDELPAGGSAVTLLLVIIILLLLLR
ncbi:MAG: PA2779 family protein [Chromatiales bacterium]|nr:PA2779 family protein [Chromatiales bacterium]